MAGEDEGVGVFEQPIILVRFNKIASSLIL